MYASSDATRLTLMAQTAWALLSTFATLRYLKYSTHAVCGVLSSVGATSVTYPGQACLRSGGKLLLLPLQRQGLLSSAAVSMHCAAAALRQMPAPPSVCGTVPTVRQTPQTPIPVERRNDIVIDSVNVREL